MIDRIFFEHIRDNIAYAPLAFRFGSAEGSEPPYLVMFKVADMERPNVLCNEQGESGQALFQFSAFDRTDYSNIVYLLENIKRQVALVKGVIGTTEQYRINNNITGGVVVLQGETPSLMIYGAIFECTLWWELIRDDNT